MGAQQQQQQFNQDEGVLQAAPCEGENTNAQLQGQLRVVTDKMES